MARLLGAKADSDFVETHFSAGRPLCTEGEPRHVSPHSDHEPCRHGRLARIRISDFSTFGFVVRDESGHPGGGLSSSVG